MPNSMKPLQIIGSVLLVSDGTTQYLVRGLTYSTPNGPMMAFSPALRSDHANYATVLADYSDALAGLLVDGTSNLLITDGIVQGYPWVRQGFVTYPQPLAVYQ